MKKICCVLLAVVMLLGIAACNKAPQSTTAAGSASSAASSSAAASVSAAASSGESTASASSSAATDSSYTGDPIEISLAHNLAVDSILDQACNKLAQIVSDKSGGKIKITVYPAAQLGNERDMIEGLQMGTIDMALVTTAYLSNNQKEFAVLDLPFVFNDIDHVKACLTGEVGDQLKQKLSDGQDIRIMDYWNSGFRDMLTSKTKLENLASFKGLQIRAPEVDVYIKMFQALGATPTPISFSEVYTSIQTGVVEGVEVSANQMYTMKFYEVGKYIAKTNHIFTTVAPVCMNSYWNKLDPDAQKIISDAMAEVTEWEWPAFETENDADLQKMQDAGIEVNDIDRDELREACLSVYDDIASSNNCQDLLELIRK